ncbi:TRAP transporter substrate-binding protein [Sporosarcina ureilytica]|uniref:C4-dicarboxylate ABC transporter substrate-binding protein n=1 Tax=Sporosarcina ureilytica TaxID=298596 RepID=A0A1D8JDX3_9BACL|nr:TRAP transporter substrate-binding protein [Sporosarcina ureilytica]AOV06915.1 hypothetical protein BI350_04585 [Sporosarcina ureilytica]
MKRYIVQFLLVLSFVFVLAACGETEDTAEGSEVETGKKYELRLGTVISEPHPWADMAKYFAEEVEKQTDGNVTVAIHANGSLGNDETMIEELRIGTVDFIIGGAQNAAAFVPQYQIFGISYLFEDMNHFEKAISHDSPLYDYFKTEYENRSLGMKLLSIAGGGTRYLSNNKGEIATPADLDGIKMRIPSSPIESEIWSALGALPTSLAWNELYSAVQTGVVNSFESTLSGYTGSKLNEVAPYVSLTEHLYMATHFSMSEATYNKLPAEYNEIIEKVAIEASELGTKRGIELDQQLLEELETLGVTTTEVDKQAFIDILTPLHGKLAEDSEATELLGIVRDLKD